MSTTTVKQGKKRSPFDRALKTLIRENEWQAIRKPLISAFIIFHAILNGCYMFQLHPYQASIVHMFWGYYHFMGFDQDYGVFAPIPRNVNPHLVAVVTYQDGSSRLWMSPRMERLDHLTRMQKERYRKFFDDNLAWSLYKTLWPEICAYIARNNNDDPKNPPRTVTLVRYQATMWPPAEGMHNKNQPHYIRDTLQPYQVQPDDLRR